MTDAYYRDSFRITAKSAAAAGLIMAAFLMLGSPSWKAVVAFVVIFSAHRAGIGRRPTEHLAFIAITIALLAWTEILPSHATLVASLASLH